MLKLMLCSNAVKYASNNYALVLALIFITGRISKNIAVEIVVSIR